MPSGRTHDRITLWSLPLVAGVSLWATHSSALTLALIGGFLFGGLMLGPDLDTWSIHHRRWGWLRWIWVPYRNSISHRSPLSHGPVIGTTIRVAYLLVVVGLGVTATLAAANEMLNLGWTWAQLRQLISASVARYRPMIVALAAGLEAGALGHYTADWALSSYKQVCKRYPTEGWRSLRVLFKSSKSKSSRHKRAKSTTPQRPRPRSRPVKPDKEVVLPEFPAEVPRRSAWRSRPRNSDDA
ncbi:MAG: metal-binding protein [Elainellaceae cyanobacterium]